MYMYNDIAGAVHVQAWPCEAGDRSGSLVEQHGDHSTLCESTSALEWSLGAADPLVDPLIASGSSTEECRRVKRDRVPSSVKIAGLDQTAAAGVSHAIGYERHLPCLWLSVADRPKMNE